MGCNSLLHKHLKPAVDAALFIRMTCRTALQLQSGHLRARFCEHCDRFATHQIENPLCLASSAHALFSNAHLCRRMDQPPNGLLPGRFKVPAVVLPRLASPFISAFTPTGSAEPIASAARSGSPRALPGHGSLGGGPGAVGGHLPVRPQVAADNGDGAAADSGLYLD